MSLAAWSGERTTPSIGAFGVEKPMADVEKNIERLPNNVMRKNLYQKLWRTCDLGDTRGERIKLPNCGEAKVRQIYPQQDGKYMGFTPA